MLCSRCMTVMGTGTRYEQRKGQGRSSYRRYFECGQCHDRVYTNAPNFQELLVKELHIATPNSHFCGAKRPL